MKFLQLLLLLIVSCFIHFSSAQTTHNVALVGNSFSPSQLTIELNDAVKWTNNGGMHNVLADDGSFTSGPVSTQIWEFTHTFTSPGDFRYYCEEHGGPNGVGMSGIIHVQPATSVDDELTVHSYNLKQNYPNPFNPETVIEYFIPEGSNVTLKVFNVTGSLERILISEYQPAGNYLVEFSSGKLTSGVYFYQLIAGDFISTKRMVILK